MAGDMSALDIYRKLAAAKAELEDAMDDLWREMTKDERKELGRDDAGS